MRSLLFVPADSGRKLERAFDAGADALILDLEDSVAAGRKAEARAMASRFLAAHAGRSDRPALIVRVNALASGLAEDDLAAIMSARPDGVLLPKPASGADVDHLAALIAVAEARHGIADGQTSIQALAGETAGGVLNAASFAGRSRRLTALSWGAEDLAAELGAQTSRAQDGRRTAVFELARSLTLLAAAHAKIDAIDTVYTDFRDPAGLEAECHAALRDGFSGKLAIHPDQVAVINRVFTPSPDMLQRAQRIVALFAAAGPDAGVLDLDGTMIDRPHLLQAERLLARAGRMRI